MLWTPLLMEEVLNGWETPRTFSEITYQGVHMLVEPLDQGQGKIVRLLSANVYDYMKTDLTPGNVVPLYSN